MQTMAFLKRYRDAKREKIAANRPIGGDLWEWCVSEHRIFRGMPEADMKRLRFLSTIFLAEKRFVPVGEAVLDEEIKVSIAAQACLPLLGLDMDWYNGWSTIYLTAKEYEVRNSHIDESGVVHETDDEFAGEAFDLGPVALSKVDIEASGWGDGYNVVIHEMAQKLDGRDGSYDGCPPLPRNMDPELWRNTFGEAYANLRERLESGSRRRGAPHGKSLRRDRTRLDPYAAESPDEFFAVCCEYFYEKPSVLIVEYPAVHERLVEFFGRDPSTWST